jgi:hypothetical protein
VQGHTSRSDLFNLHHQLLQAVMQAKHQQFALVTALMQAKYDAAEAAARSMR